MPMKNPPHPGRSIRHDCLAPLGLSVASGARVLGVSRQCLSRVVNGRGGISSGLALRLEQAGWSNAGHWRRLQTAFDLAQLAVGAGHRPRGNPAAPVA